ncbi:alpha-1,2-mannosyltransferase ALG9 [Parasteatoda tepidariorum]|uniref:alpha-1,2-mannosyltransferase ALG9 n=1 Tax=Parasteatoda tepidariorum TaxID=114398 RepID=UPI001C71B19E|nr:alpha-1,2-mannosyltransferase ALG9 [Parasteatoda tepidariorum]XP_042901368.1 alpha-1,2-mannosyltransferase ALG9 [Parasteatoda tepidariorum]XP_042901369.1 alpha-1,2-mannosyltransferase ALG9 [Parasteatoda tepidariorum]XP_042901370.1 alpha-1,2-mannosyltransferase ALG9 [Parasteatoda tepidariorum]
MPPRSRQRGSNKDREKPRDAKPPQVISSSSMNVLPSTDCTDKVWTPSVYSSFKILLSLRLCAAVWNSMFDCDEVYNYWEPMHYLLHGKGFQTWEYSPQYAIRSYAYLWLHAVPCYLYGVVLQSNKFAVFYCLRCLFAFCCSLCDIYFYQAVCKHFGNNIGRILILLLAVSAGMFRSSTSFLPSTFSMYLSTAALSSWFLQKYELAVFATAVSTLVGWPFAAILGLPIAFDMIVLKKKLPLFMKSSVISLFLILVPMIPIDTKHFGKLVFAPLNIVLYNVFTSHGANLYGTEPWTYYFQNGILNFNVVFFLALGSLPLLYLWNALKGVQKPSRGPSLILCLVPMYLWMLFFFPLAHKEERFLFPIFPMICLGGAVGIDSLQRIYHYLFGKKKMSDYLDYTSWISVSIMILFTILSTSRIFAVYKGYRAPNEVFMELGTYPYNENLHPLPPEYPVNVCVGKEWYRFPSHFFLPDNWNLQFLQSDFKGHLPKPYSSLPNATRIIPSDMNDLNLEEPSRYVNIKECDYIVDSDFPHFSKLEPRYSRDPNWKVLFSVPFLDAARSHQFFRAFYVPYLSELYCTYVDYNLLQRVNIKDRIVRKKKWH